MLLALPERDGLQVGVIMLDLDHLKQFNDTHGHPAGDEALKTFERAAQGALRESDVLAGYGGEEFVILARDAARMPLPQPDSGSNALF